MWLQTKKVSAASCHPPSKKITIFSTKDLLRSVLNGQHSQGYCIIGKEKNVNYFLSCDSPSSLIRYSNLPTSSTTMSLILLAWRWMSVGSTPGMLQASMNSFSARIHLLSSVGMAVMSCLMEWE